MANTEMIRDYIRASGYKMQYVARALKISPNALNLKLQGRTQFKLSEAERLSAVLGLSMYGTIRGAVSTFDTFNHIPDLDTAIANAGFFMEKGGVFLFDMNTPYKHRNVLGDNAFTFEEEDAACVWRNHYDAANRRVEITVDIDYHETGEHFHEQFCEYTYDLDTIRTALEKHGFALESVCDGETFGPLTEDSQRYFFCAVKQYTQLEG